MTAVIRPVTTLNDEQQAALDAAVKGAQIADEAEERAWALIKEARDLGVPDTLLCDRAGRSRSTLHRRYGPRQD